MLLLLYNLIGHVRRVIRGASQIIGSRRVARAAETNAAAKPGARANRRVTTQRFMQLLSSPVRHSWRSAMIGSTRAARAAGSHDAATAASSSAATAAA